MENRAKALEWWLEIDTVKKFNTFRGWKHSLEKDDFRKDWDYNMISHSSSCIEAIYTFIHS